jgi:hypothetical protein
MWEKQQQTNNEDTGPPILSEGGPVIFRCMECQHIEREDTKNRKVDISVREVL